MRNHPNTIAATLNTGISMRIFPILGVLAAPACVAQTDLAPITVYSNHGSDSYTAASSDAATGYDLPLRHIPQSISTITARRIADQGTTSLTDTLNQSPDISLQRWGSANSGFNFLTARGYTINQLQLDGNTILNGGGPLGNRGPELNHMDSALYDSIDIVRGSPTLTSAIGDPGATVQLNRKRPTADRRGSIEAAGGSWHHTRLVADNSGPLTSSGNLRGRAIVIHDQGGEWQERARAKRQTLYAALDYDPGPQTTLSLDVQLDHAATHGSSMYSFDNYYGDPVNGYHPFRRGVRANAAPNWANSRYNGGQIHSRLEHRFTNDWRLRADYTYHKHHYDQHYGIVGTYGIAADGSTALVAGRWKYRPGQHALDLRADGTYTIGRAHDLVFGFSHNRYDDSHIPDSYRALVPTNAFTFDGDIAQPPLAYLDGRDNKRLSSLYAATTVHLSDSVRLTAGARYNRWQTKQRTAYIDSDYRKQHLNPYLGATYDLNDHLSLYTAYSSIYKPQDNARADGSILAPESGNTLEAGIKGSWQDDRLQANAVAYTMRKKHVTTIAGLRPDSTPYYNDNDSHKARGLELALSGEIRPGWRISTAYTYNHIRSTDGKKAKPAVPAHQYKLFTTYDPGDRWTIGANLNWQSKTHDTPYSNPTTTNPAILAANSQKAYATLDLMAAYRPQKNLQIGIHANNITNTAYKTTPNIYSYGAPRNIMATIRYDY